MINLSSEAVVVFNLDGTILTWNPTAIALYQFPPTDAVGRELFGLLDCSSALLSGRAQQQLLETGKWQGVVQRKTATREPLDVSVRWTLRYDRDDRPDAVIEFGRPLESVESLAQLKIRDERFQTLFHQMPVALMLAEAQTVGQILRRLKESGVADLSAYLKDNPSFVKEAMNGVLVSAANKKAVETLGAKNSLELRESARHIWTVSPQTFARTLISRYEGQLQFGEETRILTLDGRVIDAMFTIAFPAPEDRMGMSLLCITDITGVKATENRLKKIQAEFAHSSRISILGELMATIAHELNQPLGAIALNAAAATKWLSREEPSTEQAKVRIERIAVEAKRASVMIERARTIISKHEVDQLELDLNDIVREVLLFLDEDIQGQTVRVTTRLDPALPGILGEKMLVQQVVLNLLTNSLQALRGAAATDKTIELETSANNTAGEVQLKIQDNGHGIASENLERVFDGFFSTRDDGLGMGLAICHSIVAAYGGAIKFEPGLEVGAKALVTLPSFQPLASTTSPVALQGDVRVRYSPHK